MNNLVMHVMECISLRAWHVLFLYFVSQCNHALNHSYMGWIFFRNLFGDLLLFLFDNNLLHGTAHIIAVDAHGACVH